MSDGLRLVCSLVWKDNLGQLDRDEAHGFFEALYQIFGGVPQRFSSLSVGSSPLDYQIKGVINNYTAVEL